jgi:hypothetical protein
MTTPRWHRSAVAVFSALLGPGLGLGCWGDAFTSAPTSENGDGSSRADASLHPDSGHEDAVPAPADVVASDIQLQDAADGSGAWCSMQGVHLLCEDFDTGPFPGLSREVLAGGGMVSQDGADFRSAPYSFLATTPASSGVASSPIAFLSRTFVREGQHLHLEEELETGVECVAGTDRVAPLSFSFPNYELIFYADASGANLLELGIGPDGGTTATKLHPLKAAVLVGRWVALTFEARLGQAPPIVNMTVDGAPVLSNEVLTLVPSPPPSHPTMNIGAATMASAPALALRSCSVHVDNVLFDLNAL